MNQMYEPIPKEMSLMVVPKEKLDYWKIRENHYPELKQLILTYGVRELNFTELARKWNVPTTTVHNWKVKVLLETEVQDIESIKQDLKLTSIANMKTMQRLIRSTKSEKIKVVACRVQSELIERFTKFLEDFEYKQKVADKLDITQKTVVVNFNSQNDKYPRIE